MVIGVLLGLGESDPMRAKSVPETRGGKSSDSIREGGRDKYIKNIGTKGSKFLVEDGRESGGRMVVGTKASVSLIESDGVVYILVRERGRENVSFDFEK